VPAARRLDLAKLRLVPAGDVDAEELLLHAGLAGTGDRLDQRRVLVLLPILIVEECRIVAEDLGVGDIGRLDRDGVAAVGEELLVVVVGDRFLPLRLDAGDDLLLGGAGEFGLQPEISLCTWTVGKAST